MPIKKSAFKDLRKNIKRQQRNKKIKSDVLALVRKVRKTIEKKDSAKAAEWLRLAIKTIDKAVQKGVIKKNTAARKKSRLSKALSGLSKK